MDGVVKLTNDVNAWYMRPTCADNSGAKRVCDLWPKHPQCGTRGFDGAVLVENLVWPADPEYSVLTRVSYVTTKTNIAS